MEGKNIVAPRFFHWEPTVVITTILVFAFIIFLIYLIIFIPTNAPTIMRYVLLSVALCIVVGLLLYTPRYISVTNRGIIVKLMFGRLKLAKEDIVDIEEIPATTIKNSIRIFGSDGVCGYLGKFSNRTLGRYTMYITERKNLVLISTSKRKYVLNYHNAQELKNALTIS